MEKDENCGNLAISGWNCARKKRAARRTRVSHAQAPDRALRPPWAAMPDPHARPGRIRTHALPHTTEPPERAGPAPLRAIAHRERAAPSQFGPHRTTTRLWPQRDSRWTSRHQTRHWNCTANLCSAQSASPLRNRPPKGPPKGCLSGAKTHYTFRPSSDTCRAARRMQADEEW